MEIVLDKFLDVIIDTYGKKKIKFEYKNLVDLAFKFTKNDNKLNKRGRPKKDDSITPKKSLWELVMHYYSDGPTKYCKISIGKNNILQIHKGIIGFVNDITYIKLNSIEHGNDIVRKKINELKKEKYEIMFKNNKIIL